MPLALAGIAIYVSAMTPSVAETDAKPSVKPNLDQLATKAASTFTKHIDQSTSPNKKLVVAVGSEDGTKPKWDKVRYDQVGGGSKYSYSLDDGKVGNYLVNIKANRVVGLLDGKHFGTFHRYNHESATYAWSADSQWLTETQTWKWSTGICSIHSLSPEGKLVSRFDFLPTARHVVSEWLKKNEPKLSAENRDGYVVTIQRINISNDGTVSAKVSAERPKDEESKYVVLAVTAKTEASKEGKLTLKVTAIKAVKP